MICAQQPRGRRVRDHAVAGREHAVGREQAERALECLRVRSGGLRQGRGCLGRLAEHVGHPEVGHYVQATGEEPGRAHLHYHFMGRRCHAAPPRLRVGGGTRFTCGARCSPSQPQQALRPIQVGHGTDGIPHADRQQSGESRRATKLVSQLPAWPVEPARVLRVAQDADLAEGGLREPPVLESGGVASNPSRQRDALRIEGIDAGHVAQAGEGGEPPVGEVPFRLCAEPAHRVADAGGDRDERLADLAGCGLGPAGAAAPSVAASRRARASGRRGA